MTVLTGSLNQVWPRLLERTLRTGQALAPRGQPILELRQETIAVDMTQPLLTIKDRKVSMKGAAAEAAWICSGSDKLSEIQPYLPKMQLFSDDGATLFGAYGPRFREQLGYVVAKLLEDEDTRQAAMTLWRPNPPATKDVPCTTMLDFKLRQRKLNLHVFMRSSDQWLGVPYDVFSFTMMACCVLGLVNQGGISAPGRPLFPYYSLGTLYLTAASSHIYDRDRDAAISITELGHSLAPVVTLPDLLWNGTLSPDGIVGALQTYRDGTQPFYRYQEDFSDCVS